MKKERLFNVNDYDKVITINPYLFEDSLTWAMALAKAADVAFNAGSFMSWFRIGLPTKEDDRQALIQLLEEKERELQ